MRRQNSHDSEQVVPSQGLARDDSDRDDWAGGSTKMDKSRVRKQDTRLIPLCACVYLLSFLDRSNIGVVQHSCRPY